MLNYNRANKNRGFLGLITNGFYNILNSKFFKFTFFVILLKSILFIALISDDKANGINTARVFYSMPPILVYFSFIALIISFGFIFKGRGQIVAFFIINLLISIFYIGDIWYFRSNSAFLSLHMLKMTSNLDNLGSSIFSMIRLVDLLFIVDIFIQIFISVKEWNGYKNIKSGFFSFLILFVGSTIYLTYAHIKIDNYHRGYINQIIFQKSWAPNQTISNLTPIGFHIFDAYNFYVDSKPYNLSDTELKQAKDFFDGKKENLPDNEYKAMFKGKNLLLIQWESLENFIINQKVNGQEITPTLNKILNQSFYFDNFHEQTWNGTSSDGELISNTSVFPVREGSTFFRYPSNTYKNSLPNIMKSLGYSTLASHPDKGSYWNWMPSLKSIGYEKCIDSNDYNTDEKINLGVSDRSYLKQLGEKIKAQKQPFFTYTVTLSSHAPFDLPQEYKEIKLPSNLEGTKLGGYFQSIQYTDKYIGELLSYLDKEGLLDNTVVAFYGDHEGVHKFYEDEVQKVKNPESWWLENDRKVPLIIYSKGIEGKKISINGGQADTLPTLAYLFGAQKEQYEDQAIGRNLLNTNQDYTVLSTRKYLGKESKPGQKEDMLSIIDLSDKLIRGNYFK
ncbi:Phosphoglycerol transferase MdoB [Clostridium cavendishii DSM 21758]|uniref:Phosphoglycerol transferase MdoB n=1 Tax=Clostridium cavendishii DSM 21758 TaxID=1121302 RepID=A0A1M6L074_9CLOT|nr:LTA synthase family protein [Clostridium cavendishii]SHJ64539.1 Phosphoglycerol transferase MdoB [Clostridium cavendishii DSM 21758]